MPELTEGRYTGEFVVSEGNGSISRETITVLSGETLEAGAASARSPRAASTRRSIPPPLTARRAAAGILYGRVDVAAADVEGVAIVRLAEVHAGELVWPDGITAGDQTTALGELAARDIIAR